VASGNAVYLNGKLVDSTSFLNQDRLKFSIYNNQISLMTRNLENERGWNIYKVEIGSSESLEFLKLCELKVRDNRIIKIYGGKEQVISNPSSSEAMIDFLNSGYYLDGFWIDYEKGRFLYKDGFDEVLSYNYFRNSVNAPIALESTGYMKYRLIDFADDEHIILLSDEFKKTSSFIESEPPEIGFKIIRLSNENEIVVWENKLKQNLIPVQFVDDDKIVFKASCSDTSDIYNFIHYSFVENRILSQNNDVIDAIWAVH
jgi:hypothetical protein